MAKIVTLAVIKVPSNTITKRPSESLNVDIHFTYVGPAQRILFTAVVTQETLLGEFDEIGSTKRSAYSDIPGSDTPEGWIVPVVNLPLAGVEPKAAAYGVKVKAEGTFGTVEAGDKSCLYVQAPAGISFQVAITGTPPDFGSYQKWWAEYWDPGIGDFVSCGKWYDKSSNIPFSNVQSGGYLAIFLMKDSTVSPQYTTDTFQAVNGGVYVFDISSY